MKKLSSKEVVQLINKIESEVDVQNWVVNSIHIWPIVRIYLGLRLDSMTRNEKIKTNSHLKTHVKGLFNILVSVLFNSRQYEYKKEKCDVLFITYSDAKHNKVNNKWFDSYIDPIINILEKKNIKYKTIEYNANYELKLPSFHKSKIIQHRLFLNIIKAKIFEKKINFDESSILYLDQIKTLLNENGIKKNVISLKTIKSKLSQVIVNTNYFSKILKKYQPKVLFGSNYYGLEMAMNFACANFGIKSIDIQHGVQGKYHVAYGSWKNVPRNGYALLPKLFAVWSEYEKKSIEKWSLNTPHKVKVIGNPISHFTQVENQEFLNIFNKNKINVLLTLQTGRGLIKLYKDLLNNSNSEIFWWIRKHPTMTEKEITDIKDGLELIKNKNINFNIASSSLLYSILPKMDVHITENSSVTTEAFELGIPTILTHASGNNLYEREISNGMAFYADNYGEIIDTVYSLIENNNSHINNTPKIDFEKSVLSLFSV